MTTLKLPGGRYKDPKNKVGIAEVSKRIAKKTGLNKKDALAMVNAFQEVVGELMIEDRCLHMNKLGKFTLIKKLRLGIPNYRIRFKMIKSLRNRIRGTLNPPAPADAETVEKSE